MHCYRAARYVRTQPCVVCKGSSSTIEKMVSFTILSIWIYDSCLSFGMTKSSVVSYFTDVDHAPSPWPVLPPPFSFTPFQKKKSNENKSHKSFLNQKQAHVGMELSKTSHKGWEWHYNTFTPPLHLVPFFSSESVQTQNVKQLYVSRSHAISKREYTVLMVQGWQAGL